MGFWSTVGNVVGSVAKNVVEKSREAKELSVEWDGQSDEFLARKYKNGNMTEKMAANAAFRDRYPDEDVRRESIRDALRRV